MLTPKELVQRTGCAVIIEKINIKLFRGTTQQKNCQSNLRGASYATSEVEITAKRLTSWDRGFNEQDEQVWGAIEGPYLFDKLENFSIQ